MSVSCTARVGAGLFGHSFSRVRHYPGLCPAPGARHCGQGQRRPRVSSAAGGRVRSGARGTILPDIHPVPASESRSFIYYVSASVRDPRVALLFAVHVGGISSLSPRCAGAPRTSHPAFRASSLHAPLMDRSRSPVTAVTSHLRGAPPSSRSSLLSAAFHGDFFCAKDRICGV